MLVIAFEQPQRSYIVESAILLSTLEVSFLALASILALAVLLSAYVKIATVLSLVRMGFGLNSLPSVFVTGGLALGLTFLVMYPTIQASTRAIDAELKNASAANQQTVRALAAGVEEWKKFLSAHSKGEEIQRFTAIAQSIDTKAGVAVAEQEVGLRVLAPAFLVSELREAFSIGLSLLLPFVVVELLVGITLAALGLERLDPALVSLPFKLVLFVLADGWSLITSNLAATYLGA